MPSVFALAGAVDEDADAGANKCRRCSRGDHHELEWPQIVIRRIDGAICHNQARICRAEPGKHRYRYPALLSLKRDGEQQASHECENRQEIPSQQIRSPLARGVRLKLPEEDRIEEDAEEDRACVTPFSTRHQYSPVPVCTVIRPLPLGRPSHPRGALHCHEKR